MQNGCLARWALIAVLFCYAGSALAQKPGGPPMIVPKKPIVRPVAASATLLVLCDLACNWKLDGEDKGRIEAGKSAKAKIELGEHIVTASTEDGLDATEMDRTVKDLGQSIVRIKLQPVREARLAARQNRREQAPASTSQEQTSASRSYEKTWTDLMWTKKDNGSDITWQQATDYCWNLRLDGHSDWRLPEIDELENIFRSSYRNLQMSGWPWSVSGTESTAKVWTINPGTGSRYALQISYNTNERALCVRRSGE
jgi:hypothetical protein